MFKSCDFSNESQMSRKCRYPAIVSAINSCFQICRYCKLIQTRRLSVFFGYHFHICTPKCVHFLDNCCIGNCIFGIRNPHFSPIVDFGYEGTTANYCIYLPVILKMFKPQKCRFLQQRFKISPNQNTVISDKRYVQSWFLCSLL